MNQALPELKIAELASTRDYLQEVALVLSSLQRAFLPEHPHQWQYGLEVTMRGLTTQAFVAGGQERRASIDFVRKRLRFGNDSWRLREYDAPELLKILEKRLTAEGIKAELEPPDFSQHRPKFDKDQANAYAAALWWLEVHFRPLKASLTEGLASPILLYPHHFDLSLTWFPDNDQRQLAVGWSSGDETIKEPYLYLTAYPEPVGFTKLELPTGAHWQKTAFSGAILPYAELQTSGQPDKLFQQFATVTLDRARPLLG